MNAEAVANSALAGRDAGEVPLVSIVLPTYNERETISDTIAGIFEYVRAPVEIIVVDDASPDETASHVRGLKDPRVTVISRPGTRGLASAFMRGIIESRGGLVGWMDADMSMPPSLLPTMIAALDDHDVAIGSRYAEGGEDRRHPLRTLSSLAINRFAGLVLGHGIRDYDSGFVVVRRSVFDHALPIPRGYGEYFVEFVYACCEKGLRVVEVPFVFKDRTRGVSKSFQGLFKFIVLGATYVIRVLSARLRRLD